MNAEFAREAAESTEQFVMRLLGTGFVQRATEITEYCVTGSLNQESVQMDTEFVQKATELAEHCGAGSLN